MKKNLLFIFFLCLGFFFTTNKILADNTLPQYGYWSAGTGSYLGTWIYNYTSPATNSTNYTCYMGVFPSTSTYSFEHTGGDNFTWMWLVAGVATTSPQYGWCDYTSNNYYLKWFYNTTTQTVYPDMTNEHCEWYFTKSVCEIAGANVCEWNLTNQTCEYISASSSACGAFDKCGNCTTKTSCENNTECKWQTDFDTDFMNLWNGTENATGSQCLWIKPYADQTTSTESGGFGLFREVFNDRIPFAYFFATYDMYVNLSYANASTELQTIAIIIPTTTINKTYASGTVSSSTVLTGFSIDIVNRSRIFSILPESAWNTLKSFLAFAIYLGLAFSFSKQVNRMIQIHT